MNLSQTLIQQVEKVLLGKPHEVRLAVCCLMAEGHLLIDDIPGVGKTTLALALAHVTGSQFQRIQFTSDLLPSDLLGVSIFNQKQQNFEFKPGPVFHQVILADEINRASPKTQSALLECMQEGQVSIDNQTHSLPRPFFVIATQNPHEHHGTFPLPESQLDRFMMRLSLGYPGEAIEQALLKGDNRDQAGLSLSAQTTPDDLMTEMKKVQSVRVDESLDRYIIQIAKETRTSSLIDLGLSPRGTLAMKRAVQAYAYTAGRDYAIPDDIKDVAVPVMTHRLRLKGSYNGSTSQTAESILMELINQVPVPT